MKLTAFTTYAKNGWGGVSMMDMTPCYVLKDNPFNFLGVEFWL